MRTRLEDMLTFLTERLAMTSEQYRAKAAEYIELAKTANTAKDVCEFQKLEQSFTELADNEQWVTDHYDQILHAAEGGEAAGLTFPAVGNACPR
jgi:DNA-binding ferritin-like protein